VKQEELEYLVTPRNACAVKKPLVALIKTSNHAFQNRKWVRKMFETLSPANDYYLYFLVGYEIEETQVFQNGKPYWVVNKDAPKISKPLQVCFRL
jgi:transposase